MRRSLVAGNWKMNGSIAGTRELVEAVKVGLGEDNAAEVVICPPYVYLGEVGSLLAKSPLVLGAQDLSQQAGGAFTGEVSASMLVDMECGYVIVGHSERRAIYGESDALVAEKFITASQAGLTPILCVGELLEERENGDTESVVARQLDAVLGSEVGMDALRSAVIAYEPVWAIGTGKTATPEQAQDVHAFIRRRIAEWDAAVAENMRILYGGSVKSGNAAELFSMQDIDGGLIGGASLVADEFLTICKAAL